MGGHAVACTEVPRDEMKYSYEMALDVIIRTTWTGSGSGQKGLTGLEFDKEPILNVLRDAMIRVMRGPTEKKKMWLRSGRRLRQSNGRFLSQFREGVNRVHSHLEPVVPSGDKRCS